jgi:NAD-reducing hydrogenase large subunit
MKKVVIEPVTRVEGHGKVTIHLNDEGRVDDAFFHIVEFRGFERFIQGHPYWEAPTLVQRLCGICPVSHHLAASKAIDQLVGIDPGDLSPTAEKLRRLLHYAQMFQSHALHFFYLAAPDLLFGLDAPLEQRNVVGVATADRETARKGILMRKFGQEVIQAIAGKKIHGVAAVPGGVHKTFHPDERDLFLKGNESLPNIDTMIEWSKEMVDYIKDYHEKNHHWLDTFAHYPSGHMGLVTDEGALELYDGKLRAVDADGKITLPDIENNLYAEYFREGVEKWSYMKFPYIKSLGRENGLNRVGPLARLNVADHLTTPLAQKEFQLFKELTNGKPNNATMHSHWARLIEVLHCAELMKELLDDEDILGNDLIRKGTPRNEGIGIIEAPRGTLTHHYQVDDNGKIEKCNLIVSTTHNNEPMNRAVRWVAKKVFDENQTITEPMLNQIEVAIRAYDPCLSCATHAMGQMPLHVELYDSKNNLIDERFKH